MLNLSILWEKKQEKLSYFFIKNILCIFKKMK